MSITGTPEQPSRIVVFDFDGTLGDTLNIFLELFNDFAKEKGLTPIQADQVPELRNLPLKEFIKSQGLSTLKLIQLLKYSHQKLKPHLSKIQIFDQIPELLQNLKDQNFTLGILSSNSVENIESILKKHKLNKYFDFIYSSSNLFGKDKSLKKLIKKHNLKLENTIYIGDEIRDITACRKINLQIINVSWGFNSKKALLKENPNYTVDTTTQLFDTILKLQSK